MSHNAAYRHFADREQLLSEVAAVGMAALAGAMRERVAAIRTRDAGEHARQRLREVGTAYVEFAEAEPGLFRVVLLNEALDELVAAGRVTPERRVGSELACWAAVHGFAVLHLDGPLRDATAEERHGALRAHARRRRGRSDALRSRLPIVAVAGWAP